MHIALAEILAQNKGRTVRNLPKGLSKAKGEPQARATRGSGNLERKTMSRRTETAYNAWSPGKPAQYVKTRDIIVLNGFKQAVEEWVSKLGENEKDG
jgi:hypothetical protein